MSAAARHRPGRAAASVAVVVSCEHASARVPAAYRALFAGRERLLASHRGWDPGALELARLLARRLDAPLFATRVTRLLVDTNRDERSPEVFSILGRDLPPRAREAVLSRFHRPHRAEVERAVRDALGTADRVVHLGVHSFTPVLRGRRRKTDVGLLIDPRREHEADLCAVVRRALVAHEPDLRVHRNRPYRGDSDGLTTTLRGRFPASRYLGIELEVSQRFPRAGGPRWRRLQDSLAAAVTAACRP